MGARAAEGESGGYCNNLRLDHSLDQSGDSEDAEQILNIYFELPKDP